jgi:hypothetical protein
VRVSGDIFSPVRPPKLANHSLFNTAYQHQTELSSLFEFPDAK